MHLVQLNAYPNNMLFKEIYVQFDYLGLRICMKRPLSRHKRFIRIFPQPCFFIFCKYYNLVLYSLPRKLEKNGII